MPRLERIMTEKILNSQVLGRSRNIVKPINYYADNEIVLKQFPRVGLFGRLLAPIVNRLCSIEYKNNRMLRLQTGLGFDDCEMETD